MKLWAISDLHLSYEANQKALLDVQRHPDDWLIIAGDVGEGTRDLALCFSILGERFRQLVWVPGNHELWTHPRGGPPLRGEARYQALVEVCREHGVLTPEDDYARWEGEGGPAMIVPLFLLYDYSFAPDGLDPEAAKAWAAEAGLRCTDERFLHPDPHATREDWCAARLAYTERRLQALDREIPWVLINHFPLRRDLVRLPMIPRFTIWCGTRATEDWHLRYPVKAVVSGHLHMRATDWKDGVRFEEVSLGYPRHWRQKRGITRHIREILPGPPTPEGGFGGPVWHPFGR